MIRFQNLIQFESPIEYYDYEKENVTVHYSESTTSNHKKDRNEKNLGKGTISICRGVVSLLKWNEETPCLQFLLTEMDDVSQEGDNSIVFTSEKYYDVIRLQLNCDEYDMEYQLKNFYNLMAGLVNMYNGIYRTAVVPPSESRPIKDIEFIFNLITDRGERVKIMFEKGTVYVSRRELIWISNGPESSCFVFPRDYILRPKKDDDSTCIQMEARTGGFFESDSDDYKLKITLKPEDSIITDPLYRGIYAVLLRRPVGSDD